MQFYLDPARGQEPNALPDAIVCHLTPGPWKVEGWKSLMVNDSNGDTIVCCPGGSPHATIEELQANARLIAAAPDLLDLIRAIEDRLSVSDGACPLDRTQMFGWAERCREAIADAQGGDA